MPESKELKEFEFQGKSQRLDLFLHSRLRAFSRERIKKLIKSGEVYINSQQVLKPGTHVKPGDKITVYLQGIQGENRIIPQPLPLDIIYEDDDILVVNKPAGVITHPTTIDRTDTLANALMYYCSTLSDIYGPLKPGIEDGRRLYMRCYQEQGKGGIQIQVYTLTVSCYYVPRQEELIS